MDLSFDVLTLIPSYFLSIRDVASFSLVCKSWHEAVLCSEINAPVSIGNKTWQSKLNLMHVVFDHYNVSSKGEKWVRVNIKLITEKWPNLHSLECIRINWISSEIIKNIANCTNIKYINFSRCMGLTDEMIKTISFCPNLQHVDFSGTFSDITDKACKSISRCPNIKYVDFSFCEHLTDEAVKHLLHLGNAMIYEQLNLPDVLN